VDKYRIPKSFAYDGGGVGGTVASHVSPQGPLQSYRMSTLVLGSTRYQPINSGARGVHHGKNVLAAKALCAPTGNQTAPTMFGEAR